MKHSELELYSSFKISYKDIEYDFSAVSKTLSQNRLRLEVTIYESTQAYQSFKMRHNHLRLVTFIYKPMIKVLQ
jgi:hypothetical protein